VLASCDGHRTNAVSARSQVRRDLYRFSSSDTSINHRVPALALAHKFALSFRLLLAYAPMGGRTRWPLLEMN
jgi:hypothetical protein